MKSPRPEGRGFRAGSAVTTGRGIFRTRHLKPRSFLFDFSSIAPLFHGQQFRLCPEHSPKFLPNKYLPIIGCCLVRIASGYQNPRYTLKHSKSVRETIFVELSGSIYFYRTFLFELPELIIYTVVSEVETLTELFYRSSFLLVNYHKNRFLETVRY